MSLDSMTEPQVTKWRTGALATAAMLALLVAFSHPGTLASLPPALRGTLEPLTHSTLSAREEVLKHKGYYEKMDAPGRLGQVGWEVAERPADIRPFSESAA